MADTGYAWVVVIASIIQLFCTSPALQLIGLLFGPKLEEIQASESQISAATSLHLFTWSLVTLFVGPLVEIKGERFVSFCASLCSVVGFGLCAFMSAPVDFILAFGFAAGIGSGFGAMNCLLLLNKNFKKRIGLAMGIFVCSTGVGGFVMPQVVKLLRNNFEIETVILIYTAICSSSFIASLLIRPDPIWIDPPLIQDSQKEEKSDETRETDKKSELDESHKKDEKSGSCLQRFFFLRILLMIRWNLLKEPKFLLISLAMCFIFNGFAFFGFDIPDICFTKGLTVNEAADIITIGAAAGTCCRLFQGYLGDVSWLGSRFKSPKTFLYLLNSIIFGSSLIGLAFAEGYILVLCCVMLSQISVAGAVVHGPILMREYFLKDIASAIGICNVLRAIFAFVLGSAIGVIKENFDGFVAVLLFMGSCVAVPALVWSLQRSCHREKETKEENV